MNLNGFIFSRHYGIDPCEYSPIWGSTDIRPHVNKGFSCIWLFQPVCILLCHLIARYEIFPQTLKGQMFCATTKKNHVTIRHYEARSTSGPMLIRVSPLYCYYNLSVYYFDIFYRPLWYFALKWTTHNHRSNKQNHSVTSLYSLQCWKTLRAPCLPGGLFIDCLYHYSFIFYRP